MAARASCERPPTVGVMLRVRTVPTQCRSSLKELCSLYGKPSRVTPPGCSRADVPLDAALLLMSIASVATVPLSSLSTSVQGSGHDACDKNLRMEAACAAMLGSSCDGAWSGAASTCVARSKSGKSPRHGTTCVNVICPSVAGSGSGSATVLCVAGISKAVATVCASSAWVATVWSSVALLPPCPGSFQWSLPELA